MKIGDLTKFKRLIEDKRTKLWLLIMTFVILAVVLFANYRRSLKQMRVREAGKKEVVVKRVRRPKKKKARKKKPIEIELLLQEAGREDPFLPAAEKYTPTILVPEELNLVGIVWDETERPLAIINNMIVAEGDMIGDKEVVEIGSDSVVIRENGREYILRVGGFRSK